MRAKDLRTLHLALDALMYGEDDMACTREGGGVLVGRGSASLGARGWFSGASFSWGAGVRSLGRRVRPFERDLMSREGSVGGWLL